MSPGGLYIFSQERPWAGCLLGRSPGSAGNGVQYHNVEKIKEIFQKIVNVRQFCVILVEKGRREAAA